MSAATPNLTINLLATANNAAAMNLRSNDSADSNFSAELSLQMQARQTAQNDMSAAAVNPATPAVLPNATASTAATAPQAPDQAPLPAPTAASSTPSTETSQSNSSTTSNSESTNQQAAQAADQNQASHPSSTTSTSAETSDQNTNTANGNTTESNSLNAAKTQSSDKSLHDGSTIKPKSANDAANEPSKQAIDADLQGQLQAYVTQGLQYAQAMATAAGNPVVKSAGLADSLINNQTSIVSTEHGSGAKHAASLSAMFDSTMHDTDTSLDSNLEGALNIGTSLTNLPSLNSGSQALAASFAEVLDQATPIALSTADAGVASQQLSGGQPVVQRASITPSDTSPPNSTIYQALGSEGWDAALSHKVVMMVSNQQQEVEMQLNPPHLGPIEVKMSLNQDQANITFVSAHAQVRDAIEASMPRLQQMLGENGIQLSQANVQSGSQNNGNTASQGNSQSGNRNIEKKNLTVAPPSVSMRMLTGLPGNVNLFV